MWTQDAVWKTCRERWTIGMDGERKRVRKIRVVSATCWRWWRRLQSRSLWGFFGGKEKKSLGGQVNKDFIQVWRYSSRLGTVQHTLSQIFGDNLPDTVLFSCSVDVRSFEESTGDRHAPPTLPARRSPQSCLLKATRFWNLNPLSTSCCTQIYVCTILAETFQVL